MNIFQTIGRTTRRIEPFHSRFFADALRSSFEGDQDLFRGFWILAVDHPPEAPLPASLEIKAEEVVDTGRVDIVIYDREVAQRVGIEIKTTEASSTKGQLARYQADLETLKPKSTVRMVYLTPFNKAYSRDRAARSIAEFEAFSPLHLEARHLSWIQVANINWAGGGDLWSQHQEYVRDVICDDRPSNKRQLDDLLEAQPVAEFWKELAASAPGHDGGQVEFSEIVDPERFINAFRILVESSEPGDSRTRKNKLTPRLRTEYEGSRYGHIHAGLFALTEVRWAWVDGKQRYGLRVPHAKHPSGVSLCTVDEEKIVIAHS